MKKHLLFSLMFVSLLLILPVNGNAVPLQIKWSAPVGYIDVTPGPTGTYYLDYDVSFDGGATYEQAFCVDLNQEAPKVSTEYSLNPLPTDDKYFTMAWIAENFGLAGDPTSADAQVAIWEALTDYNYIPSDFGLDINAGNFTSTYDTTVVQGILDDAAGLDLANAELTYNWMLATNVDKQDYLVRVPKTSVPEPSSLLLLGTGLVGIGVFRRRFKG